MKIAVVCANPWETFLPFKCQGNARTFYQWLCEQSRQFNGHSRETEQVERYGDLSFPDKEAAFKEKTENHQIVYVQSHRREILETVLDAADLVIVGMPGTRKECDKIYLSVLPWKEKCVFLWDEGTCREKAFFRQIQNEYKLEKEQIAKFKGLSSI